MPNVLYDFRKNPRYLQYVWYLEQIDLMLLSPEHTNVVQAFIMAKRNSFEREGKTYRLPLKVSVQLVEHIFRKAKNTVHLKLNWHLYQAQIEKVLNEYNGSVYRLLPDATLQMSPPLEGLQVEQDDDPLLPNRTGPP